MKREMGRFCLAPKKSHTFKNPSRDHVVMPIQFPHFGTGGSDLPTTDRVSNHFCHLVLDEISFASGNGNFIQAGSWDLIALKPCISQF